MKRVATGVLALVALSASAAWAAPEFDLGIGFEQFRWREYDTAGNQLLEEKGPRFVLHGHYEDWQPGGAIFTGEAELYFANVDYDGQTQGGTPLQTDTYYTGIVLEGGAGYLWPVGKHGLGFIGSVGIDSWIRSLQDAYTSGGTYAYGYDEEWFSLYARLAAAWNYRGSGYRQRMRAGMKYPLYIENNIPDLAVTLQPEPGTSYFVSWESHWPAGPGLSMGIGLYHEYTKYRASDPEPSGPFLYYQPESRQWVSGARFLMSF